MQIELSVSAMDCDGVERKYEYRLTVDKMPVEQLEAHAKSMLAILDGQANTGYVNDDEDDEGDGDGWKKPPPSAPAPVA